MSPGSQMLHSRGSKIESVKLSCTVKAGDRPENLTDCTAEAVARTDLHSRGRVVPHKDTAPAEQRQSNTLYKINRNPSEARNRFKMHSSFVYSTPGSNCTKGKRMQVEIQKSSEQGCNQQLV